MMVLLSKFNTKNNIYFICINTAPTAVTKDKLAAFLLACGVEAVSTVSPAAAVAAGMCVCVCVCVCVRVCACICSTCIC